MNLNATPETVQAVAQVLKMAKILDDRMGQPDKARIMAWSEQVERHKLAEPDLMDGLQAFYDGPSAHAIGIGDLIAHAKTARTVRIGKEDRAEREARQAELDAIKPAPEETRAVAAAFVAGPAPATERLKAADDALHMCVDAASARTAIAEYFAAKAEAQGRKRRKRPAKDGAA